MKKIAVILSGCGNKDGSEITEAVSTLIALSASGAKYTCFAPAIETEVVNFLTDAPMGSRNALIESARIARSQIEDIGMCNEKDFDAVVFPGGFGAAKVLSNWASQGAKAQTLPKVASLIRDFHKASKPIGAICIAPTLVALVLGKEGVSVTIGNDRETSVEIGKTGAHHESCAVDDYITDRENKVITSPAYMYGEAKPHEVFKGIQGLVKELVDMA